MRIILSGASGKMGTEIQALAEKEKDMVIVGRLSRGGNDFSGKRAEILIDFSGAEFFLSALACAEKNKIPFLSGTTGLAPKQMMALRRAAKKIPVLWAPNTSMGIHAVREMLRAAQILKKYDLYIEETHHQNKKDAPSGTARDLKKKLESYAGSREIKIHSVREGEVFGIHKIVFRGPEEVITIQHEALNRTVFAKGALVCARWLLRKKKGLYTIEDVFRG